MTSSNIDQNGWGDETFHQRCIADYSAYLMLKTLGYSNEELALQFDISTFEYII